MFFYSILILLSLNSSPVCNNSNSRTEFIFKMHSHSNSELCTIIYYYVCSIHLGNYYCCPKTLSKMDQRFILPVVLLRNLLIKGPVGF